MSQIVQDVAPKAQIYFATADDTHTEFGDDMYALANAGCRVICDDVQYLDEPVFQDGDLAGYVNDLCANYGVVYISSAGNQGGSSNYQTYKNMSGTGLMSGKHVFDFTGSSSEYLPVTLAGGYPVDLELQWDDPWGSSKNDYNLYLINPGKTKIVASSTNVQPSNPDPLEIIQYTAPSNGTYYIAVERKTISSSDPDSTARTKLTGWPNEGIITFGSATSSTFGHSCADSCLCAAAIDATSSNYNTIEVFSGQGPSYNITFGTGTRTIHGTRQKPDLACFDGVNTSLADFTPFYGTSASSPHIAGTAALLLSAKSTLTATQARAALRAGTIDEGAFGNDYVFGYGRLDAFKTITQALSGSGKSYAMFKTVNASIPDGTSSLSSTISPTLTANADSVYLSFTVDSHPRWGDLSARLTSPDGTTRTVLTRPPNGSGTSTGEHPNVILGDNASTALESYDPDSTEVIGYYIPQNALSSSAGFYDRGISGNWTFNISDSVTGDTGSLKDWGIYWKVLPNANESLTLSGTAPYIWSSDNSLKTVTVSQTVNNGAIPVIKLDTITANEAIASGDIVATTGTNTTSIQLRAKCDANTGRVYTAKYELTDIGGYDSTFYLYVPVLNKIGHNSASPITSSGGTSLGLPSVNPLLSGNTTFTYTLSTAENIDLSIFDLRGKWHISVDNGAKSSGLHTVSWNGDGANGTLLPDGTYIYQLSAGGSFFDGTITLAH
jgi:subtilisin-like proprotein convertase family protein